MIFCKVVRNPMPGCLSILVNGVCFSLIVAVAALQGPAAAFALDAGYCAAPAEMMSTLQADAGGDVYTLAMMNVHGADLETEGTIKTAQVIMSNSDFSKGYVVRGNAPLGEPSSELCLSLKIRDLEVNDYRLDREPTVTSYTFNNEAAEAQCETVEANVGKDIVCGERSRGLEAFEEAENGGQRLAFQGIETRTDENDGV